MAGQVALRGSANTWLRGHARWLVTLGLVGFGGLLSLGTEANAASFAAQASVSPRLYYIGDSAGSHYTFVVKNTGTSTHIGAVEIRRPNLLWKISGCPVAPVGWLATSASNACRYRSAAGSGDDIKPGQSATFDVKSKTAPGSQDHIGTWRVVVSNSNNFAAPSLLKFASATPPGLTTKLYTFQLTGAVVTNTSKTPGSACPAANKSAIAASSKTIVICGYNRATTALTPNSTYSSLGGTFVGTPGTFLSGSIPARSGNVVLASWNATIVTNVPGSGKTVLASIGSQSNRTSSLRTFKHYRATNELPVLNDDAYSVNEDTHLTVGAPGVLSNDTDAEGNPLTATNASDPPHGTVTLNANGSFEYDPDVNYNGPDTFTYVANDGYGNSLPATVTITVNAVNDTPQSSAVSVTTNEDTPKAITLVATDVETSSLTYEIVGAPSHGDLGTVTGSSVTYTPDPNYHGPDSFTYRASDGSLNSNTSTVTITVTPVNDAPVANNDSYSTTEDTPLTVVVGSGVLANDTDVEGSSLTATEVADATHGDVTVNPDGSFTYTPDVDYSGPDSFTYKANDGSLDSNTATVNITVDPVQDAPVAVDDGPSISEDSTGTVVTVLGNDTDADGDTLVVSAVDTTGTTGVVTNNGTDVTYDPNGQFESLTTGQTATDTFTYTASDGNGGTDTATVTVTVTGVNDLPNAVDDNPSTDEASSVLVSVLTNDSDAEGAVTVIVVNTSGTVGSVTDNNDGTVTYDPNGAFESLGAGDTDTDSFTYTIADGNGATDTATVTVTINGINDAPVGVDDAPSISEDSTGTTVNVLGNDTDADADTLVVTAVDTTGTTGTVTNNGTDVTYDPNGMFEYLSTGQTATDVFTYTASDGNGGTDTATVTVTVTGVNDLPDAVDDNPSTDEASSVLVSVLTNDSDAEGAVTVTVVNTSGTVGSVTNHGDGTVTYDPNGAFESLGTGDTDTDSFTYTISDGDGATDTATVTVTINGINDAPVGVDDGPSVSEDSTGTVVTVLGNDTDADGDTLVVSAVDTTGTTGVVTNNGTDVTYDPDGQFESLSTGQTATDTFTYTVSDSQGGTDTATVTVTITGVNDLPVAVDDTPSTDEDSSVLVSVLTNDSDAEGAVTVTAVNTTGTDGTVTNNGTDVTYDPNGAFESLGAGDTDTDVFTYTIADGNGATDTATVTVTINGVNDAPVGVDDGPSISEDSTGTVVNVLGNDTDADADTLVVSAVDTTGTDGTVTNNGTDVTYDPNGMFESLDDGETDTDVFTYTASDGNGGTDTATVTVTITGADDLPVAVDDSYETPPDTPLVITAPGVLANDTDPDDPITAGNASDPANGDVTLNADGSFTYTPDSGYSGPDSFTYDATDGTATDSATVNITVEVPNAAPTADNTSASGNEDALTITVTLTGHDTDGEPTTFIVDSPANGSVGAPTTPVCDSLATNTCTATVDYTPDADYFGSDAFTYRADDGIEESANATADITVNAVNDVPSFSIGGNQTVNEDVTAQTVTGFATGMSAGPANESTQVLTFTVTNDNNSLFSTQPDIDETTGDLTFTPASNAFGFATVDVKLGDDGGIVNSGDDESDVQQFTITINAVNDVPSFTVGLNQNLDEDNGAQSVSSWAGAISKGPANESGQTVEFIIDSVTNSTLFSAQPAVSPTGTLTYTSALNKYGTSTVTLHIKDNGGTDFGGVDTSPTQQFTITVNAVNDPPVALEKNFTVQANMKISLSGLLTGVTDTADTAEEPGYTPTFTVHDVTVGASCIGCTVSNVNLTAGTFDFDPPAGGTGTSFSMTYRVKDTGFPGPGVPSVQTTINFTINGPVIWFVDEDAATVGTGRLSAPFDSLSGAITAYGTNTNQRIFVQDGNSSGNVTLQTDGWLLSDAVTGTDFDTLMGITPPAGTISRPSINSGIQRVLTGSVTLGDDSVVRGFDLTPGSGTQGLIGSGANGVTVNQMSITTVNARGVNLAGTDGVISLTKVSTSGADRGISLTNVNVGNSGSFTIVGTGTTASGGKILASTGSGATDGGIHMDTVENVSLDRMTIGDDPDVGGVAGGAGNGIYGEDVKNFVIANSRVRFNGTSAANNHDGIHFINLTGTSSITSVEVEESLEANIEVEHNTGTGTLTVASSNIHDNDDTLGNQGLYVNTPPGSTGIFTLNATNNTYTNNRAAGLQVFSQGTGKVTANITGGTFTQAAGFGMNLANNGTGGLAFNVNNSTLNGCAGATCGALVNVFKGSTGTGTGTAALAGTVNGLTINHATNQFATALWVHGVGRGEIRVAVTNNTITNAGQYGIHVLAGENDSTTTGGGLNVQAKVSGNTVTTTAATGGPAVIVEAGVLAADSSITMCAEITGNTANNPNGSDIFAVIGDDGAGIRLPSYVSVNAQDTTAAAAFIAANNAPSTAGALSFGSGPGFTGGAPTTCTVP